MRKPDRNQMIDRLHALLRRPLSDRARNWTTLGAGFVFVVVGGLAINSVGGIQPQIEYLFLAALLTPALQVANAAEYKILGALVQERVGWWEALETTTLATAANLLPLPGGALVRVRELSGRSGNLQGVVAGTIFIGINWLGAGLLTAAAGLLWLHRLGGSILFAGSGIVILCVGRILFSHPRWRTKLFLALFTLEVALCLTAGSRIALVVAGTGMGQLSWPHGMVLSASGPAAALLGFFPAGLGLQEILGGLLAPVANIPPELGVAGIATDRLLGYGVMAVFAGLIWLVRRMSLNRGSG